jgi:hypothetical protein
MVIFLRSSQTLNLTDHFVLVLESSSTYKPVLFFCLAGGNEEIPAVIKPTQDLPPPYSASGQQQISQADFQVNNE